jgi:hypothetical protein
MQAEAKQLRRVHLQAVALAERLPSVPTGEPDAQTSMQDGGSSDKCGGNSLPPVRDAATGDRGAGSGDDGDDDDDQFFDAAGGGAARRGGARRLGLRLLRLPEPMWEPRTQLREPLTSLCVREREALLAAVEDPKTRARMQCSEVISDMAAFKAANPGCTFEDFVRWFSPKDWVDKVGWESSTMADDTPSGRLSRRMSEPGNLWEELWEGPDTAAVPACEQLPLFDYAARAERLLSQLESTPPLQLVLELLVAQACAVTGHFGSCPWAHQHARLLQPPIVQLAGATEALAQLLQRLLAEGTPGGECQAARVGAEELACAASEVVARSSALEQLVGRASTLQAELSSSIEGSSSSASPAMGGRFTAQALRPLLDALLSHEPDGHKQKQGAEPVSSPTAARRRDDVPVERKSEREAVTVRTRWRLAWCTQCYHIFLRAMLCRGYLRAISSRRKWNTVTKRRLKMPPCRLPHHPCWT